MIDPFNNRGQRISQGDLNDAYWAAERDDTPLIFDKSLRAKAARSAQALREAGLDPQQNRDMLNPYSSPLSQQWRERAIRRQNEQGSQRVPMTDTEVRLEQLATLDKYRQEEKARREYHTNLQTEAMMKDAFSSMNFDKSLKEDVDIAEYTANRYMEAGKRIMKVNPEKGMQLIEQGNKLLAGAENRSSRAFNTLKAKEAMKAELAYRIKDEKSLQAALPELAKLGFTVEPEYRDWNENTAKYFETIAKTSDAHNRDIDIQFKEKQVQLNEDRLNLSKQREDRMTQQKEAADARYREGMELKKSGKSTPRLDMNTQLGLMSELQVAARELGGTGLFGTGNVFDDLNETDKIAAINDYYRKAVEYGMSQGITNPEEAYALARQDILSQIQGGKFKQKEAEEISSKPAELSDKALQYLQNY
jgi:hypothetical protein